MRGAVPTESEASVKEHVDAYLKVTEMVNKKKELLKEYKAAK